MLQETMIVRRKKVADGARSGGASWYNVAVPKQSSCYLTHPELFVAMREYNIIFDNVDQDEQDKLFIAILRVMQDYSYSFDKDLLKRIICAGGFVSYINELEKRMENVTGK